MRKEETKIPTAEEILRKQYELYVKSEHCDIPEKFHEGFVRTMSKDIRGVHPQVDAMIEFAKLHVKQALNEAYNNSQLRIDDGEIELSDKYGDNVLEITVDKESILNSYPLENIK